MRIFKRAIQQVFILCTIISLLFYLTYPIQAQEELSISEFSLDFESNRLYDITSGPDGNIWFTISSSNKIGRITPGGVVSQFAVPSYNDFLSGITSGPDGNLWFTEFRANKIGRISPNGNITEFSLSTNLAPQDITKGPDGNLWFTSGNSNKVGRITTNGVITEFTFSSGVFSGASHITSGPDGNIWFTKSNENAITKITSNGTITNFPLPIENSHPFAITSGPDGNLWFTELVQNKIGKISPDGSIVEFPIPTSNSYPDHITAGPDGNIWFIESNAKKVGRITPNGEIEEFPLPDTSYGITSGSDGNLWFTEWYKIGRINLSNSPSPTPSPPNSPLPVPYFSQNAQPWGPSEYDHTKLLGVTGANTTMDRWGCAVTSAAMILNYHNIKEFQNGTSLNPGTLNEWLKDPKNNGYSYGYGKNGWYSYINWNAISKLTQQLYNGGKAPYKLEWQRRYPSSATTTLINNDLTTGNGLAKIPEILFVNNSSHFIVAKGIEDNTYLINDPEWNYSTLASFNNAYSQVDRYVPSQTNLSYITAVVNPDVELLITDSQGRKSGKIVQDGEVISYDEIPNVVYAFEAPISNPNEAGELEKLGTGVNSLLLPKPNNGNYTITTTSKNDTYYTLNISTFKNDGENIQKTIQGGLAAEVKENVTFDYSQTQPTEVMKEVTFDVLQSELKTFYAQNQITSKGMYSALGIKLELAERASKINKQPLGNKLAILGLKTFLVELKSTHKAKKITDFAYKTLYEDTNLLIKALQETSESTPTPTPDPGSGS